MGCQIRITRDDTDQAVDNELLAELLRSIGGVAKVEVLHHDELGSYPVEDGGVHLTSRGPLPDGAKSGLLLGATNEEVMAQLADAVERPVWGQHPPRDRYVPRRPDGPLFASSKQSEVDEYVARKHESMGHTEIHRS